MLIKQENVSDGMVWRYILKAVLPIYKYLQIFERYDYLPLDFQQCSEIWIFQCQFAPSCNSIEKKNRDNKVLNNSHWHTHFQFKKGFEILRCWLLVMSLYLGKEVICLDAESVVCQLFSVGLILVKGMKCSQKWHSPKQEIECDAHNTVS